MVSVEEDGHVDVDEICWVEGTAAAEERGGRELFLSSERRYDRGY